MIKLLDTSKQVLHLLNQVKDFYIESDLKTADKLISFKLPRVLAASADLKEERYLLTATDEFVIKEVNYSDKDYIEVFGKLNLDDLKGKTVQAYDSTEQTVDSFLTTLLQNTDWTFEIINPTNKRRTIRSEVATIHDMIIEMVNTYGVEVEFDTLTRTVKVYQTIGTDRGAYAYTDLNIKSTDYQSDTYDYITRIYPYGKDGLTVATVNGGLTYITNSQFSNKIIEYVWKDDRYTDAQALYDDAAAKLAELSKPRIAISLDVIDLAKAKPEYSILDFRLGDFITVLDKVNGTKYQERIFKLTNYPLTPEKNKVEMSNTKLSFVEFTKETEKKVDTLVNSITSTITGLGAAIADATNKISGNAGGFIVTRMNENNQPYEMLVMNTNDIATASNVWRWNVDGLGFSSTGYNGDYETAITNDGRIVANFITAGVFNGALIQAGTVDMRGAVVRNDDNETTLSIDKDGSIKMMGTIQSTNYDAELAGWRIDDSGYATLNEATVRGSVILPTAGATNNNTESGEAIRFYAGATYEDRANAKFKVLEDGSMFATLGNFGGTFTGSLTLGDIFISDETPTTDGLASIKFIHDTSTPVAISAEGSHFTTPFYLGTEDDRRFIVGDAVALLKTNSLIISQTESATDAAKDVVFPNAANKNLVQFGKNAYNMDLVNKEFIFNSNVTVPGYNFIFQDDRLGVPTKVLVDGSLEVYQHIGFGKLKIIKRNDAGNTGIDFTF